MKTPVLLACFAVATVTGTAASPSLKDPAKVAADWNQTFEEAKQPLLVPGRLGLEVTAPKPPSVTYSLDLRGRRTRLPGDGVKVPPGWQLDPGLVHGKQDDTPPPDAKPWYYRGEKFWIVPIAADATPDTGGGK